MRTSFIIAGGLIAAGLSTPALAGKSFALCEGHKNALDRVDAARAIFHQWPALSRDMGADPDGTAKAFFAEVAAYEPKPVLGPIGTVFELFKAGTPLGGKSYIIGWGGEANTAMDHSLLKNWAAAPSGAVVECIAKDQPAASGPRWTLHLRDTAGHVEQALAHEIAQDVFPGPGNSAASIAFHHDQLDNKNDTFTMHATLGAGYGGQIDDDNSVGAALFLGVDRVNSSSPTPSKPNATDLSAGIGFVALHGGEQWSGRVNLSIQGDTDDHFAAGILYIAGQASIWPSRDFCVAKPLSLTAYFELKCDWNLDLDYAHVFNRGGFLDLSQKEYARGGGDVSLKLAFADLPGTYVDHQPWLFRTAYGLLDKLSVSASYKVLEDLSGAGAGLSRFDASIDYKLGSDDDTSGGLGRSAQLSLAFSNGRADRTLQPQRYWEIQLKTAL